MYATCSYQCFVMATKAKVRKYYIDYLKYGFIAAPHDEGLALCLLCEHTPMKDNIFGSEAFILLTKMEMHYRRSLTNFKISFKIWLLLDLVHMTAYTRKVPWPSSATARGLGGGE